MYIRRSAAVKYVIAAYVGSALYCEWFVYFVQPVYWPKLKCADGAECTYILFIADPQLQGDNAVYFPWNHLFAWDSDRFLSSTFHVVARHFRPDVLVYLGDLMDEGSTANMQQFHHYAKRLFNIFDLDYTAVTVWLPGDNDIGGENEPIKRDKVAEFDKIFQQSSVITERNITFYKVNGITHDYPTEEVSYDYKIVVSHYPVTNRHVFGQQVNKAINPDIYFCAHDHEAKYVKQDLELKNRVTHYMSDNGEIVSVQPAGDDLLEVYVPTCSYRMGTDAIGFGAAVFDHYTKELKYTVFWSPRRFPCLIFYAVTLLIVVIYSIIYFAAKLLQIYTLRQHKSWTKENVPLLT